VWVLLVLVLVLLLVMLLRHELLLLRHELLRVLDLWSGADHRMPYGRAGRPLQISSHLLHGDDLSLPSLRFVGCSR
jgi:hypothetical protein